MSLALAYRTGVPWNESKYSNPEFDRLLTMAEGTLDVDARRELMAQLERILQDDGPIVQPVWRAIFTFTDKRVPGLQGPPDALHLRPPAGDHGLGRSERAIASIALQTIRRR
jgi:peptide/nickel transport system substrate-binding protein